MRLTVFKSSILAVLKIQGKYRALRLGFFDLFSDIRYANKLTGGDDHCGNRSRARGLLHTKDGDPCGLRYGRSLLSVHLEWGREFL